MGRVIGFLHELTQDSFVLIPIKCTRAMAYFTVYPYQSVMTYFIDMRIKQTDLAGAFTMTMKGSTSPNLATRLLNF